MRDLLTGRKPKDFDVATDATPYRIKKLFSNAKIIGKRFKLVHMIFHDTIIETATFRSGRTDNGSDIKNSSYNVYGEIHEDVVRRDFTINALYYDPINSEIIDYVGGYNDLLERRLRTIVKAEKSFREDPVRMIRAVKYSIISGCRIDSKTLRVINKNSKLISLSSVSRLFEEFIKIFKSPMPKEIINSIKETGLLKHILPELDYMLEHKTIMEFVNSGISVYSDCYNMKLTANLDFFWCILLFGGIDNIRYQEDVAELIVSIREYVKKILGVLKIPNRIVYFVADVFLIYMRFKYSVNKKHLYKLRKSPYYPYSRLLKHIEDRSDFKYIEKHMRSSPVFGLTEIERVRKPVKFKKAGKTVRRCVETRKPIDIGKTQ